MHVQKLYSPWKSPSNSCCYNASEYEWNSSECTQKKCLWQARAMCFLLLVAWEKVPSDQQPGYLPDAKAAEILSFNVLSRFAFYFLEPPRSLLHSRWGRRCCKCEPPAWTMSKSCLPFREEHLGPELRKHHRPTSNLFSPAARISHPSYPTYLWYFSINTLPYSPGKLSYSRCLTRENLCGYSLPRFDVQFWVSHLIQWKRFLAVYLLTYLKAVNTLIP